MNRKECYIAWKHFFTETTDIYEVFKNPSTEKFLFSARAWDRFITYQDKGSDCFRVWRGYRGAVVCAFTWENENERMFLHYESSDGRCGDIDITKFYGWDDDE